MAGSSSRGAGRAPPEPRMVVRLACVVLGIAALMALLRGSTWWPVAVGLVSLLVASASVVATPTPQPVAGEDPLPEIIIDLSERLAGEHHRR